MSEPSPDGAPNTPAPPVNEGPPAQEGPDPVIGAGIALLGILVMGTAGALDAHYAFDAGVLFAVAGAALFVLFVALSALKQRRAS